jgi:opacity protein-like surface antigen
MTLLLTTTFSEVNSQSDYYDEEEEYEELTLTNREKTIMMIFGELSYGTLGLGVTAGFRYSFVSLSLGFSGFAQSIPNSIHPSIYQPFPKKGNYQEESYPFVCVYGDAGFYYDIGKFSIFATIGYFSQSDTILAREFDTNYLYKYKVKTESGICFGVGAEYLFNPNFIFGVGYHTKKGVFLQLGYIL